MKPRRLASIAAAAALAACSSVSVAIKRGYDFRSVKRVAVLGFGDAPGQPGSGAVAGAVFEKYLLKAGYDVIERRQIDELLKEQSFALSGAVDPATVKQLGRILGVDALVLGSVTEFTPAQGEIVTTAVSGSYYGGGYGGRWRGGPPGAPYGRRQVVSQSVTTDASVGLTARMVDVQTGSVLWIGSDSESGSSAQDCADEASGRIMKGVKSTWPATLLK
jgi:hypothetical protein